MAAPGGKKKVKIERERQTLALPLPAQELADLLNPLIAREIATIAALDTLLPRESDPGYVELLRAAKTGKQASVEQMSTMIRVAGAQPAESGTPIEAMLKLQSTLARRLGTTPMLRALRLAEAEIVRAYGEVIDRLDGVFRRGLDKCWHRAIKRFTVLTAHVAIRGAKPEPEEMIALPRQLSQYFANGEDRVCFRCLFDRPGRHAPLERIDPHPYIYLCAACHDEVAADFPNDFYDSYVRWPARDQESHVLERALGRPSKLKAELLVLAKMSGLAPEMPPLPSPYKSSVDASPKRRAPAQPRPRVELGGIAESPLEQAYSDALFDYDTVRGNW